MTTKRREPSLAVEAGPNAVWRVLGVHRGEEGRVLIAGTVFFVTFAGASIGLNVADALFFLRFGVDALPWMILLSGLVVMAATFAYAAALGALGPRRWSWLLPTVFGAWLVVERIGVGLDAPGIYPVVWQWGQVIIYVSMTLLWDLAGELCNARQAKRLFPLFASAGIAGAVVGNALTGPLANTFGTENLLIIQAVLSGGAGAAAWSLGNRFLAKAAPASEPIVESLMAGYRTTVGTPLFRLVAGVAAAMSLLFFLVFLPFSEAATESFDSEAALAGFLGTFSSVATAATLVVSLLLANRLFAKFGVVAVLLVVALVYVAGFGLWLVSFGLVTATLFRGLQWVAINALGGTAFSSLFNVLTGPARSRVRDFVSAVPMQLGTMAAGALLLVGNSLSTQVRFGLSLAVALAFAVLVWRMRAAYAGALLIAVRDGLSDVFTSTIAGLQKPHLDADAVAALTTSLADASSKRRQVAAVILGQVGDDASRSALRGLLVDADAAVRVAALDALGQLDAETLESMLGDPASVVRCRVVEMLAAAVPDHPAIAEALDDESEEVRASAARHGPLPRARAVVAQLLEASDDDATVAALHAGAVRPALLEGDLTRFAAHPDRRVRAAAAAAMASRPEAVATLCDLLADHARSVRVAAGQALAKVDPDPDRLRQALDGGALRSREAMLEGLLAVAAGDPAVEDVLQAWGNDQLDRAKRVHRYRELLATSGSEGSSTTQYLESVLEGRERRLEAWALTALGTESTRHVVPLVVRGIVSGDTDTKSEALEALESIADRRQVRPLVAMLEEHQAEVVGDRYEALQAMAVDENSWIRALATRSLTEEMTAELARLRKRASEDENPLVRSAIHRVDVDEPVTPAAMSVLDRVLALQRAPIFAELDPEDLEFVAHISTERHYMAGEIVYEQDTPGEEMLVVVGGAADIITAASTAPIARSGPGAPVGELALLRGRARMARVVAGENGLDALVIDGSAFLALVEEHTGLALALMATLADRIALAIDEEGVARMAGPGAPVPTDSAVGK